MPIHRGSNYFQWGNHGKKYYFTNKMSEKKAYRKAKKQMKAAFHAGYKEGGAHEGTKYADDLQPALPKLPGNHKHDMNYQVKKDKHNGVLSGFLKKHGYHFAADVADTLGLGEFTDRKSAPDGVQLVNFTGNLGDQRNAAYVDKHALLNATSAKPVVLGRKHYALGAHP